MKSTVNVDKAILHRFANLAERLGFESPEITNLKQYPNSTTVRDPEQSGPLLVTSGPGLARDHRCRPLRARDFEEDCRSIFIRCLHDEQEVRGEGVTSFFVLKSRYFAFFSKLQVANRGTSTSLPAFSPESSQSSQLEDEIDIEVDIELEEQRLERLEWERLEQERQERLEQLERERSEQERLERERLEREVLERKRLEQERLKQRRLEQERLEQERLEQGRLERERLEREVLERKRLEQQRLEQQRLEQERLGREEERRKESRNKDRQQENPSATQFSKRNTQLHLERHLPSRNEEYSIDTEHVPLPKNQEREKPAKETKVYTQDSQPALQPEQSSKSVATNSAAASSSRPTNTVRIDFKVRERGIWKDIPPLIVNLSDPSEVEHIAIKNLRKEIRTFDTNLCMLALNECFEAVTSNGTNTILLILQDKLVIDDEMLNSAAEIHAKAVSQGLKRVATDDISRFHHYRKRLTVD
ncbi:MAG: hypothetical protein M1839_009081 [Geoglossum umbratile]|nr:MAG: hypothetical protein M1839_009081 [Geoglossum umbratile]